MLTPPQIVQELNTSIVGHERAKRTLAIGIRNRWRTQQSQRCADAGSHAQRFLISGSSGTGKSLLVQRAAQAIGAPFASVDALELAGPGAQENTLDLLLESLVDSVKPGAASVEEAVHAVRTSTILLVDGLDRLFPTGGAEDDYDLPLVAAQQAFLRLFDRTRLSTNHGEFCSDHVLMVAECRVGAARLAELWPDLQSMFPYRMELDILTDDDLLQILSNAHSSPVRHYIALMAAEGLALQFTPDALEAIAREAGDQNRKGDDAGARRLSTVIEGVLDDLLFDPESAPQKNLTIDAGYVTSRTAVDDEDDDLSDFIL